MREAKTELCFISLLLLLSVLWSVILSLLLVFMTLRNEARELRTKVLKNLSISTPSLSVSLSIPFFDVLLILVEIPTRTHFIRTDVSITFMDIYVGNVTTSSAHTKTKDDPRPD